eukprot:TRINITY_DN17182_c0_g1_i1.p1 TRINITY_DN17182_c0_g1~~TRINITY_DN17182_c0_g1_i1.p1  ORF type:complete len:182 (+),score=7.72 TRINITY_DN17182_c0_g1_i1:82-546(+)
MRGGGARRSRQPGGGPAAGYKGKISGPDRGRGAAAAAAHLQPADVARSGAAAAADGRAESPRAGGATGFRGGARHLSSLSEQSLHSPNGMPESDPSWDSWATYFSSGQDSGSLGHRSGSFSSTLSNRRDGYLFGLEPPAHDATSTAGRPWTEPR